MSGKTPFVRTPHDKLAEFVSVRDFGARGDGVTDDTVALQAALNAVALDAGIFDIQADKRGGTIYMPPGRYRVTATLNFKASTRLVGAGANASLIVNESATGDVLSVVGLEGGSLDLCEFEDFAVVQKAGVAHAAGYAIKVDGNAFGTSVRMRSVSTYGTSGGIYLDWVFPATLTGVQAFAHVNGAVTRFNCTSTTFQNCYAGACSGSGYKIAGNYMSLVGCASDSNALDGYELYYDGGASTAISLIGCGSENFGREGISEDRVASLSVIAPRLLAGAAAHSCLKLNGGDSLTILSPVFSGMAANANPVINVSNASGAYPSAIHIVGWGGTATNYTTLIDQPDYVTWAGNRSVAGAYNGTLRLGGIGAYTRDLQTFFMGANFPAGSAGTAYGANFVPVVGGAYAALVASAHYKPVVNAAGQTIARLVAGPVIEAPTVTAGTVTRHEGQRINDQPAGSSADANFALGDAAVPVGRWSICNLSARTNLFAGPVQWGSSAGPKDLFGAGTPEGAITAAVGSTYRRSDGGAATCFYVKESGAGNTGWVAK